MSLDCLYIDRTYVPNQHRDYLLKVSLPKHNTRQREKNRLVPVVCLSICVAKRVKRVPDYGRLRRLTSYRFFTALPESVNARNETQTTAA